MSNLLKTTYLNIIHSFEISYNVLKSTSKKNTGFDILGGHICNKSINITKFREANSLNNVILLNR